MKKIKNNDKSSKKEMTKQLTKALQTVFANMIENLSPQMEYEIAFKLDDNKVHKYTIQVAVVKDEIIKKILDKRK